MLRPTIYQSIGLNYWIECRWQVGLRDLYLLVFKVKYNFAIFDGFAMLDQIQGIFMRSFFPEQNMSTKKKSAKKQSNSSTETIALYNKLIATNPAIERKGDANPYTSLNGNMFTLLYQSVLAIRLPEDEREKFLKKHKTTLFEAYGAVMKEYVAVPDALLKKTKELEKYLAISYEYAKTLKLKPTKKKK
jgi:hypothetical protein